MQCQLCWDRGQRKTYLEDHVHDTSSGSGQNEVRVADAQISKPQETIVHHTRNRQLAHGAKESEGAETNVSLRSRKSSRHDNSSHVWLYDVCLLHLDQIGLSFVTCFNSRIQLLLQRSSHWLQGGHAGHLVGTEGLEDEQAATHDDGGGYNGSGPAPAAVKVDGLHELLEHGRHAPAVLQAKLCKFSGVVDEFGGVELYGILHDLSISEQLVQCLRVEHR